jgi:hypothetical protein
MYLLVLSVIFLLALSIDWVLATAGAGATAVWPRAEELYWHSHHYAMLPV